MYQLVAMDVAGTCMLQALTLISPPPLPPIPPTPRSIAIHQRTSHAHDGRCLAACSLCVAGIVETTGSLCVGRDAVNIVRQTSCVYCDNGDARQTQHQAVYIVLCGTACQIVTLKATLPAGLKPWNVSITHGRLPMGARLRCALPTGAARCVLHCNIVFCIVNDIMAAKPDEEVTPRCEQCRTSVG